MRSLLAVAVCLLSTAPALAAEPPAKARDASEAIKKGLAYLDETGANWMESRSCAGCHHLTHAAMAFTEAKTAGYKVNEKFLGEIIAFIAAPDNRAKLVAEPKDGKPENLALAMGAVHALLAMTAIEKPSAEVREWESKTLKHILERQAKDGSWSPIVGTGAPNPPVFDENVTSSALTAIAVSRTPADAKEADAAKEAAAKALRWLNDQKGESADTQFHVLRLWLQLTGGDADKVKSSVERVLALQNKDGGWSQPKGAESDAWASGQALYVLSLAGRKPDDPAVQRAREFLIKSQLADGSWPMKSRPRGNPPRSSKNLEPITYGSTSWAILGLIRSSQGPNPQK